QGGGQGRDEDVDDQPHALERIHQRNDLDVERDRRATQQQHHHADQERTEEAEVVAAQHQQVDGHDQDRAGQRELVHVRPRHPLRGDAAQDGAGQVEQEREDRQRRPDPRPQQPLTLRGRRANTVHRPTLGVVRLLARPCGSAGQDRLPLRDAGGDGAPGQVDGVRDEREQVGGDRRPHQQQ
ncbi:hypothetical protein FF38_03560, partial [Lucilia cuprina]